MYDPWVIGVILILLVVIILIVLWIAMLSIERENIKSAGLDPKRIRKEPFFRRFRERLAKHGKVYFEARYETTTVAGRVLSLDMFTLIKGPLIEESKPSSFSQIKGYGQSFKYLIFYIFWISCYSSRFLMAGWQGRGSYGAGMQMPPQPQMPFKEKKRRNVIRQPLGKITFLLYPDKSVQIQLISLSNWTSKNNYAERLMSFFLIQMGKASWKELGGKANRLYIRIYSSDPLRDEKFKLCRKFNFKMTDSGIDGGHTFQRFERMI